MKAKPQLLSASIRYDGGKPVAVLELALDARDAVKLAADIGETGARVQPIADMAEQLDKEEAAELAAAKAKGKAKAEGPKTPTE